MNIRHKNKICAHITLHKSPKLYTFKVKHLNKPHTMQLCVRIKQNNQSRVHADRDWKW